VDVVVDEGAPRPPVGTPVVVEVRDVALADAPSVTVAAAGSTAGAGAGPVASVELDVDDGLVGGGHRLAVWARCAASGAEQTAAGDWITMESIPVRSTDRAGAIRARVRLVGGAPPASRPPPR
jgi:uncharacterized lipoprotein YbaY